MSLETQIMQDIKEAMLSKNSLKLEVFRSIKSAILLVKTERGAEDLTEEKEIEMPTLREGYRRIESAMNIKIDRSLIEMTIIWDDPKFATRLANGLIERVNDYIRKEAIEESRNSIQFLEKELTNKDANTKVILSYLNNIERVFLV